MVDFFTMRTQNNFENKISKLLLIASMSIFGTIGLFTRYTLVPSSVLAFYRGAVGGLMLIIIALITKRKHDFAVLKKNALFLFVSGAMIGFNWVFLFEAYKYTTVSVATLCYYMAPIIVMITSPFLFHEKLGLKNGLCILAALTGCVFISGVLSEGFSSIGNFKGVLLGLAAAILYAIIIIMNKKHPGIDPFDKTSLQLISAGAVMFAYSLIVKDFGKCTYTTFSVIIIAILCLVHTGFAYAAYFYSIDHIPAQTIAFMSYLDPVVAIIISVFVLKEASGINDLIGSILILGAAIVSEIKLPGKQSK